MRVDLIDRGRRSRSGRWWRMAVICVALMGAAACGSDDGGDPPEAQPAPDVTHFTEGTFDELPVPPRGDPVGERSEIDGVTARSYEVRDQTTAQVIEFYDGVLEEWDKFDEEVAGEALRADYVRDGRGLRVTAQPATTVDEGTPTVQLSLQLGPEDQVFVTEEVEEVEE